MCDINDAREFGGMLSRLFLGFAQFHFFCFFCYALHRIIRRLLR